MSGIMFEKDDCPCLKCIYLMQATRMNESANGDCDMQIHCAISGCPKGVNIKSGCLPNTKQMETYRKLSGCIEMLKRCIELKSKGRAEIV